MQHFADIALPPVVNGELKFYPSKYVTTYKNWLENIQDWCISRQLWWGHRIPAYFLPTAEGEEEKFVVALTVEDALAKAKKIAGVISEKVGFTWAWTLPSSDEEIPHQIDWDEEGPEFDDLPF